MIKRSCWIFSGFCSLFMGCVGAVVPLLPTTPFVILSAFCFSNGSPRLHRWLRDLKWFGRMIRDWESQRVISLQAKRTATLMICLLVSYPLLFKPIPWLLKAAIVMTIAGVLGFIWRQPSSAPPSRAGRFTVRLGKRSKPLFLTLESSDGEVSRTRV